MKMFVNLWHDPAEFFLEWEIFETKLVEKVTIYILYLMTFFLKIVALMR